MSREIQQLGQKARHAIATNKWVVVKQCARQILSLQNDNADGWFLTGLVSLAERQRSTALNAFTKSIQLDPQRYDAGIQLASLCGQLARHAEAVELLQRYEKLLAKSPKYLFMAAETYHRLGLHDSAWPLYEAANQLQKNAPNIEAALAACSTKVGKISLAIELYDKLLSENPHHQRNHYERSKLETAIDDTHILAMQASLLATQRPAEQNIFINYALAKELEDLERWQEAFVHYKAGGDAAKQQCTKAGYQVEHDIAVVDSIIENCSQSWIDSREQTADRAKQPIFVLGLPRTGTTLVEKIISSHSQVETADESFFLEMSIKRASRLRTVSDVTPSVIKAACGNNQADIAGEYLDAISYRLGGHKYFVEKYPFNFLYIGFIARYFPNAKIVLLKRNAMDACFAMYKQPFFKFSYTQEDLVKYHRAYSRLIEHWRNTVPNLVEVEYEALVDKPEVEIRTLMSSLGFEFEQACVDYHLNGSASATASAVQIREKPHTRSVDKWLNWEAQLKDLKNGLAEK